MLIRRVDFSRPENYSSLLNVSDGIHHRRDWGARYEHSVNAARFWPGDISRNGDCYAGIGYLSFPEPLDEVFIQWTINYGRGFLPAQIESLESTSKPMMLHRYGDTDGDNRIIQHVRRGEGFIYSYLDNNTDLKSYNDPGTPRVETYHRFNGSSEVTFKISASLDRGTAVFQASNGFTGITQSIDLRNRTMPFSGVSFDYWQNIVPNPDAWFEISEISIAEREADLYQDPPVIEEQPPRTVMAKYCVDCTSSLIVTNESNAGRRKVSIDTLSCKHPELLHPVNKTPRPCDEVRLDGCGKEATYYEERQETA